jgi:predicted acylesterase/phospholipase RssA
LRGAKSENLDFHSVSIYTDLFTLRSRTAHATDVVAQALAKSCRFPFAFVGHGSGITDVDGGLAMNLPVDDLRAGEHEYGKVVAISFSEIKVVLKLEL